MKQELTNIRDKYVVVLSNYFKTTPEKVLGTSRESEIVKARHIAQYLLVVYGGVKLKEVGRMFNRHHSSVINGIYNIMNFINNEEADIIGAINEVKESCSLYNPMPLQK